MAEQIVGPVRARSFDVFVVFMNRWSAPGSLVNECLVHTGVRRLSDAMQRVAAWVDRWPAGCLPTGEVWLEGKVCVFAAGEGASVDCGLVYGGPVAAGRYVWREADSSWRLASRD